MEDTRSALIAAMYQGAEDIEDKPPEAVLQTTEKSRHIRVGIVQYEVPTVQYVASLEALIAQQGQMIREQRRMIEQIVRASVRAQRATAAEENAR